MEKTKKFKALSVRTKNIIRRLRLKTKKEVRAAVSRGIIIHTKEPYSNKGVDGLGLKSCLEIHNFVGVDYLGSDVIKQKEANTVSTYIKYLEARGYKVTK